jgi:hypothetical protein
MIHFIEDAMTWIKEDTVSFRPRSDFSWVKDPFVLKLPEIPSGTGVKR